MRVAKRNDAFARCVIRQIPLNDAFARCVNERYLPDDAPEEEEEWMEEQTGELITVVQLPVIQEHLHTLQSRWRQRVLDAEAMVCTEETIQTVKAFRAETKKEFDEVEALRKQVKNAVEEPYKRFEAVYKDCVTNAFKKAYEACSSKISEVESDIKRRCEEGLRDYFAELCAAHHVDWLEYEQAEIRVDMASARAKTPKKLREQLVKFVVKVAGDIDTISGMEDADEILAEYKLTLDLGGAIGTVSDRHRRVEAERAELDARATQKAAEDEAVRRVEALAPPVIVKQPDQRENTMTIELILYPTKAQFEEKIKPIMMQLKQICDTEGIEYE